MKKQVFALFAFLIVNSCLFASYYPVNPDILAFQQYSDKPIANRLKLPEKNPGYFGANDDGNTFMSRFFYITKELSDTTIKEVLEKTAYRLSIGFVPLDLTDTIKSLEAHGYKRHKEESGDKMQLMNIVLTEEYLKGLNQAEKTINKNITVKRAQSKDDIKTWVKTACEAFKEWGMKEKDLTDYAAKVLANSHNKGENVYFYIGYFDNKAATVALVVHYKNKNSKDEDFAYCSWGGTIKQYRKKGILKAIGIKGMQDVALNDIKIGYSMSQPNAVEIHKKLGFNSIENGQYYWYMYPGQSWYSSFFSGCILL